MPTASAAASPATRRSASRRTWTPARSSAGSIPATSASTRQVFAGDWRGYDPFDGTHRLETHEIPSPAVCSVFRTYQGWTALTRQGPTDGTLRLIPIAEGISYVLLRALQDDVAENDLCGAKPGRALGVSPEWHAEMMAGMVSIPEVQPGDTVWWHTDICHSVADEHAGKEYASVIYIGSAPDCAKNRAYLPEAEGGVPRRPLGARFRRDGLRGRFQGPRHRRRPHRPRPRADGVLTTGRAQDDLIMTSAGIALTIPNGPTFVGDTASRTIHARLCVRSSTEIRSVPGRSFGTSYTTKVTLATPRSRRFRTS